MGRELEDVHGAEKTYVVQAKDDPPGLRHAGHAGKGPTAA